MLGISCSKEALDEQVGLVLVVRLPVIRRRYVERMPDPARSGNRRLRAVPPREVTRYRVRVTVPRLGGWRDWGVSRSDFEQRLAAPESPAAAAAEIESETRRGRDYVRVTVSAAVDAADVAEALTTAWDAFRQAAGDDITGWDMAAASAEVRPESPLVALVAG
jgi:hypothetical protein